MLTILRATALDEVNATQEECGEFFGGVFDQLQSLSLELFARHKCLELNNGHKASADTSWAACREELRRASEQIERFGSNVESQLSRLTSLVTEIAAARGRGPGFANRRALGRNALAAGRLAPAASDLGGRGGNTSQSRGRPDRDPPRTKAPRRPAASRTGRRVETDAEPGGNPHRPASRRSAGTRSPPRTTSGRRSSMRSGTEVRETASASRPEPLQPCPMRRQLSEAPSD